MAVWRQILDEGVLRLGRAGSERWLVTQHAAADRRPYLHPLLTPDEAEAVTEDRPPHHPWQHGLYVGLNQVNGVGFWTERETDGTFHPAPLAPARVDLGRAAWDVACLWRAPDGSPLLDEQQGWTLTDAGDSYHLDLAWSLTARTPITFGQYAYGGLFLRMPYGADRPAAALDSEGRTGLESEGQRARWLAVGMQLPETGAWGTVAILDHPANPEHPVPWRIDGQYGIAPSRCIAGAWHLAEGESTTSRYRVQVFGGRPAAERLDQAWWDWVE